ncbi:MAG: NAD-dependent epimerase/dehydratase [Prevotella sp.]|nr:NAD-dependent epimerase/dehydratase [Prevotella sp.]
MDQIISTFESDLLKVFKNNLPWEVLSGRSILITGSTGLIGGCLVDALMKNPNRDYHIYAGGRDIKRANERFKEYASCDTFHFVKFDVMYPLNSDVDFDFIIHAASYASPNAFIKTPVEVMKSNFIGVSNLMEYGLCHRMKRFVYISSGEVYGEGDGRPFDENYSGYVNCMTPRSCYPSSKRAAETLCVSYAEEYGADVVIARPCHVYGPNFSEKDNRVYAQFIRNILNDADIVMKSTGEQFRSWCYVVDCVSAILYVLLKGEKEQVYNIADSQSVISIKDLAEIIAEIGNKSVVMEIPSSYESLGYNVVTKSVFSTEKLESLGWSIEGTMKEKLEKTIKYERSRNNNI